MIGDDQAVKVYEGGPADVQVLRSVLESAGIEVVTAGAFFGATREIHIRGRDVPDARALISNFQSQPREQAADVLQGPWPKK